MNRLKVIVLAGSLTLAGAAQAQTDGIVQALSGNQDTVGAAAVTPLQSGPAALLEGVNTVATGVQGLTSTLVPGIGGGLNNGITPMNLNTAIKSLGNANVIGNLSGLEVTGIGSNGLPVHATRAGDLPASFVVAPELLDTGVLQSIIDQGISALPAGALPALTMVPVASLGGLDPALAGFVKNGEIAAGLLPDDLPLFSDAWDPATAAELLSAGVPAALLPNATPVDTLAGL